MLRDMNETVVVDASLAFKWVIQEPYTAEAMMKLSHWRNEQTRMLAPAFLVFEVTNALHRRVHCGLITDDDAKLFLTEFLDLGPELNYERITHYRALELAYQFGRPSAYDAHYLALAEREGCEFWTADERLWNAVKDRLTWVRWIGEVQSGSGATS